MNSEPIIQTILVPQGAEYNAVCRGLKQVKVPPVVIPIPIGAAAGRFLSEQSSINLQSPLLIMGLCGSLQPAYQVGDLVLYQSIIGYANSAKHQNCNPSLINFLIAQLPLKLSLVTAWTSDRFVASAAAKQQLRQTHHADVVDMEGTVILDALPTATIATLRVVSDDYHHNLPDLSTAISSTGELLPMPLIATALQQPLGMVRLVRGAQIGLRKLEQTVKMLF